MEPPKIIPFQPRDHIRRVRGQIPRIRSIDPRGEVAMMWLAVAITEARAALRNNAPGAADEFLVRAQNMLTKALESFKENP